VKAAELWFDGRGGVDLREAEVPAPGPGQVRVASLVGAISAGTELLFYRGELRGGVPVDAALPGYRGEISYPMRYGYATVGVVEAAGRGVEPGLEGRLVFSFTPHASAFLCGAADALPVPGGLSAEDAAFFANMETAVTLVLDGRPGLSDRVSVFGLGVVGLCTTALLARFPLSRLRAFDLLGPRRDAAAAVGAEALDPCDAPAATEDVVFELTGSPAALGPALAAAAFSGLLVIGSWYGERPFFEGLAGGGAALGTAFHRGRVRVLASQVSSIDPSLSGRWDRERRREAAWDAIRAVGPSRWVTHRYPLERAGDAYALLAGRPSEAIQVLLAHARSG
jgi:threonine dehydrogenase-like Zn-dependent dehydrogenase